LDQDLVPILFYWTLDQTSQPGQKTKYSNGKAPLVSKICSAQINGVWSKGTTPFRWPVMKKNMKLILTAALANTQIKITCILTPIQLIMTVKDKLHELCGSCLEENVTAINFTMNFTKTRILQLSMKIQTF
jgi:hypothetical protein